MFTRAKLYLIAAFFTCFITGYGNVGLASIQDTPVVYGSIIRNNARITFEWPQPVQQEFSANGKTLSIYFAKRANPNLGQLLSNLYPFIRGAKLASGGRQLILTMDQPYKVRTFESDHISGIDLLDIDPTRQPNYSSEKSVEMAQLSPSAGENDTATATAQAVAAIDSDASLPEATASATAMPPSDAAEPTLTDASASPEKRADPAENNDGALRISFSMAEESAILRFPFTKRMDIAAFIRNNTLWIILGEPVEISLRDFDPEIRSVISKPEIVKAKETILRMPVSNGMHASVAQIDNTLEWTILISGRSKPNPEPLTLTVNTEPPVIPHVFVESLQTGESITIKDPVIGDEMLVVPLFKPGEGVALTREFIDFSLLDTAQGLVVVKKADDVEITNLRNGMRISTKEGATLTPGLPKVTDRRASQALQIVPTLYPYEKWLLPEGVPFRPYMRELTRKISITPDVNKANDLRLEAAKHYLAVGMSAEALAMLDGIKRTDPDYYRSSKLAGLEGAANFVMGRYQDAYHLFAASELNNNKEMDYWRNMLSDLTGREGNYSFLELNDDYISHYPPLMRQELAIVAADRHIEDKQYNRAIRIFETLRNGYSQALAEASKADRLIVDKKMLEDDLIQPIAPYVNYLMAKIAADTGQSEESIKAMNKLAENFDEPFVRSRAEFSRIIWQMNKDIINKKEVIERLERLRLAWHGDSLELKVLDFLGEIYSNNRDYINAMRIWDGAVDAYAGTPKAIELQRKLEDTFVTIFKEGTANQLPPLEALALYYQYKNYAPPGSIGRDVLNNLAERLVSVDLLTQAASLLEYQMRHDAEKSQRSELGARIASIYLLNNEPEKALRALQDSVYGENTEELHNLRNRLAARALVSVGQSERAWQVLIKDDSAEAERIRLEVLWGRRDWVRVIPTVENLLRLRKDITEPITLEESEQVIKLALAYVFENNIEQLQYLRDYFTPLMQENPNKPLFDFITSADVTPTPTNFEEVVDQLQTTRSFIEQYRAEMAALNKS
jgi:hypothetical protein